MKKPMLLALVVAIAAAEAALGAQNAGYQSPPMVAPAAAVPAISPVIVPAAAAVVKGVTPSADYVIGPEDVLAIVFWRDKDLSTEVMVRPDGKISLPLLNEIMAAGLTPEQLRQTLTEQAQRFVEDPNVTVVVKTINSRRVFVTGQVSKPGPYPLTAPTTVLQLISMTGGLLEYADAKNIVIMRNENGQSVNYRFNYKDVIRQKNLKQNIELKPGDTVVIP
jgi:polysaccharide biosynthesis/export protein